MGLALKPGSDGQSSAMLDELSLLLAADQPRWAGLSERLLDWFGSSYAFVGLLDNEGVLACHSSLRSTNRERPLLSHCEHFPAALWSGSWGTVLREQRPVLDNSDETVCSLGVPLRHGEELLGSLHVSGSDQGYAQGELERLTRLARALASIVAARRETEQQRRRATAAEEDLERRNQEIEAVNEVLRGELALRRNIERQLSRALRNSQLRQQRLHRLADAALSLQKFRELGELLDGAVHFVRELLHSQQAALSVQTPTGRTWHVVSVTAEHPRGNGEEEARVEALRTYQDVEHNRIAIRDAGTLREAVDGSGPCLVIPLLATDGERFGLIQVWDPREERFDAADRNSLLQFAQIVSAHLQLRQARSDLVALRGERDHAISLLGSFQDRLQRERAGADAGLRDRLEQAALLLEDLWVDGQRAPKPETLAPVDMAAFLAELIEGLAPPAGFRIVVHPPQPQVETEVVRLRLVLVQLVGNALRHHDKQSGQVDIRCTRQADGFLALDIEDDGPGLAAPALELFESELPPPAGAGLGIAWTRQILRRCGGALQASCGPQRGTRLRLLWPACWREQPC